MAFVEVVQRRNMFYLWSLKLCSLLMPPTWSLQENICVCVILVTLQQPHGGISVPTAFAPHSADSCVSPELRGVNTSTCTTVCSCRAGGWHFAGAGGGCDNHVVFY